MSPRKIPKLLGMNSDALVDSARTAVATLASLLLAKALKFPEYYWAPISTIIIMQSSIQPFQGAWQRFVGTALGATLGAVIATYVGRSALVYAVGIFVCGIFAAFSRAWSAYRVAGLDCATGIATEEKDCEAGVNCAAGVAAAFPLELRYHR
jgi:uncharacterized membrane protein YccC